MIMVAMWEFKFATVKHGLSFLILSLYPTQITVGRQGSSFNHILSKQTISTWRIATCTL